MVYWLIIWSCEIMLYFCSYATIDYSAFIAAAKPLSNAAQNRCHCFPSSICFSFLEMKGMLFGSVMYTVSVQYTLEVG